MTTNTMNIKALWQTRRWFVVLMFVNATTLGGQIGVTISLLIRRNWTGALWQMWGVCVAAFAVYIVRYTEEWRLRVFVNIAAQREAIARDLEIKTKILDTMNAAENVEVRVVATPSDKETRH